MEIVSAWIIEGQIYVGESTSAGGLDQRWFVNVGYVLTSLCVEGGGSELPVQFVGCYSSSLTGIDYAYVVDPLTWKVCVQLCLEKNVKYAGIEAP